MVIPKVLIVSGDGINCERETSHAFELAGGETDIRTINQLIEKKNELSHYQIIAFPGGFSFGDELGSGKVFSLKIKYQLKELLSLIKEQDKLVIGICNGFQMLLKLGLLPDLSLEQSITLAPNQTESGDYAPFLNKWANLSLTPSKCIWTKDIKEKFSLPIRHGEGRIALPQGKESQIYSRLKLNKQIVLAYDQNINGSYQNIAGLCDEKGRVFGLMPHPEAALYNRLRPDNNKSGFYTAKKIFDNAIHYFQ